VKTKEVGGVSKLSFKSILKFEENVNDNDSAASQSSSHMRKFFVDEGYSTLLKNKELFM